MKLFRWIEIGRDYLVEKSRGLKEGQIDSRWYELPVIDKKKTCQRQNKKSWQHHGNLDKWMEWKGAASGHGRIEVESAWDTIRWAQCDSRNAGHKNADDDKQDEISFSEIHILWSILSTVFRDIFKTPLFAQAPRQALLLYAGFILKMLNLFLWFIPPTARSPPSVNLFTNIVTFFGFFLINRRVRRDHRDHDDY